jgi:hypothetical protein
MLKNSKYREPLLFFLALLVGTLLFVWVWSLALEASAQVEVTDTQPFELQHPDTKEPGTWIPRWLQMEHLHVEHELSLCQTTSNKRIQLLGKKDRELKLRAEALDEEKKASRAATEVLGAATLQLEQEKEKNDALSDWLWGTSSAGAALAIALVLVLVL